MIWPLLSITFFCAGFIALRQTKERYPQTIRIYPMFLLCYFAAIGLFILFGPSVDLAHLKPFLVTYPFVLGGAIGVALVTGNAKAKTGEEQEARDKKIDPGADDK